MCALKLAEKSFIKISPNKNLFCIFKNNIRDIILINNSASDILSLCNGVNSIDDIVNKFK